MNANNVRRTVGSIRIVTCLFGSHDKNSLLSFDFLQHISLKTLAILNFFVYLLLEVKVVYYIVIFFKAFTKMYLEDFFFSDPFVF